MATLMIESYRLPVASVNEFVTQSIGLLDPMPANEGRTDCATFTALDCFDQSVRQTNRLLLDTGTNLELLSDDAPQISQATKGKAAFVSELDDGPVKRALSNVSKLRSLLPIGTGERHRAAAIFVDDEGKTHCRVNLMQLVTSKDRAVVIELQGLKGYDESLALLREHINQLGGTPLNCRALHEHLFPVPAAYDPKPDIPIAADDTALEAANHIIAAHIPLARANEFGIVADYDTEFLHDYRIHLRKIRSVLSLFKGVYDEAQTEALKARFSALMQPTGALRDLDVYLLDKQRYYDLLPESLHEGLDSLFNLLAKQRNTEKNQLVRHLQSPSYQHEITNLEKLFTLSTDIKPGINAERPPFEYAADRIGQRYRKVSKIARSIGPHTSDARIHELRIHCKKLRYLMEFFASVFSQEELSKTLKSLKGLQDELGLFNDYSVQQENLSLFAIKLGALRQDDDLEIAQSVGALIAILHNRQLAQRTQIFKKLKQFNRPKTQQAFEQLFQQPKGLDT